MALLFLTLIFPLFFPSILSLSTVSISENPNDQTLICALISSAEHKSTLNCTSFPPGIRILVNTNSSFSGIVAGNGFVCAVTPPSVSRMGCWRSSLNWRYKLIYRGPALNDFAAGNSHVCGVVTGTDSLDCWQWREFNQTIVRNLSKVAVGENFVCGLFKNGSISCLGSNTARNDSVFKVPEGNYSSVYAGFRHACGIAGDGSLNCWGDTPAEKPEGIFSSVALGDNRSCGLLLNGTVVCWGQSNFQLPESLQETRFMQIEAKGHVFCGVLLSNYSLFCWGNPNFVSNSTFMVFDRVLPGPCRIDSECLYGQLPGSGNECNKGFSICKSPPLTPAAPIPSKTTRSLNAKMVSFLVIGCVGCFAFLVVFCFFLFQYCKNRGCRIHDSGRLDDETPDPNSRRETPETQIPVMPVLEKRLSHLISNNGCNLEEFSLQELLEATDNFSENHRIGTGSFGSVYHAILSDQREVAIKRAEHSAGAGATKRQEDKDNAFINELESLSRLHHKNLVRLLGFCEDQNELVLIYEYMRNGTVYEHLHKIEYSPLMSSWANRLQVALDAARGIEYLHVYANPPIIHRDIKSSNILLDDTWTAKVSDFGLSLMGPKDDESHLSLVAAGTVGYIDPEYYRLQQLTTKSDVYSFGVVLIELLSGNRAIHKNENGVPRNVVDFVVPYITQDEIHRILDRNVPPPTPYEIEAVAYVGYLAADCVSLEGRNRPTMTEIVNSLERALAAWIALPTMSRSSSVASL